MGPTHQSVPSFIISRETLDKARDEALMMARMIEAGLHKATHMETLALFVLRETGRLE